MNDYFDTERKGLPSASGGMRVKLCPGSLRRENAVREAYPEFAEWSDPIAREGEFLHAVMTGDEPDNWITEEQEWVINRARKNDENTLFYTGFVSNADDEIVMTTEQRGWLHDDNGVPLTSGRYDRLYINKTKNTALLSDYKFGWEGAGKASDNIQLMWNGAILYTQYGFKEMFAALNQPRLPKEETLTIVRYSENHLKKAVEQVTQICKRAFTPKSRIYPGEEQCKYCLAKAFCPQAFAVVRAISDIHCRRSA